MGRYDNQISRAKILLTELNTHSLNASGTDSYLKLKKCMNNVYGTLPKIEEKNKAGLLNKFVDAMFETKDDRIFDDLYKDFINDISQLEICKLCKCASCVLIDEDCRCKACVYGAYVTGCEGGAGLEKRSVQRGTVYYQGKPVSSIEYNRSTGKKAVIIVNKDDTEERIWS